MNKKFKDVTFENMSDKLVEVVPALKEAYLKELAWWKGQDPGAHNIFSNTVLLPHIDSLLDSSGHDGELHIIFDFLEFLANHSDVRVQEVISVSVMECICSYPDKLRKVQRFLGPECRKFCKAILGDKYKEDIG
jgi:hypothetical protein